MTSNTRVVPDGGPTETRAARILARIRAVPVGFVTTYGDLEPGAPRLAGHVLATTGEDVPWYRVVHSDGSIPKGQRQRELLLGEGVPMRGDRVDLRQARLPRGFFGAKVKVDESDRLRPLRSSRGPANRRGATARPQGR